MPTCNRFLRYRIIVFIPTVVLTLFYALIFSTNRVRSCDLVTKDSQCKQFCGGTGTYVYACQEQLEDICSCRTPCKDANRSAQFCFATFCEKSGGAHATTQCDAETGFICACTAAEFRRLNDDGVPQLDEPEEMSRDQMRPIAKRPANAKHGSTRSHALKNRPGTWMIMVMFTILLRRTRFFTC